MPKSKLSRSLLVVMLSCTWATYAQNNTLINKLSSKPHEQILVFEVGIETLAKIIEAAAWKMNYDSVVISSAQDKIMLIRGFPPSTLQYGIFLTMAKPDSALQLTSQGFWFFPPDSIPRYSKALRAADRDLLKLFLYAVTQEIALSKGAPLHDRALPDKPFLKFMSRNLLNPGLASWYMMKDHPRTAQKSAIAWSVFFGLLDVGYLALGFAPDQGIGGNRPETDWLLNDLSKRQLAIFGALSFRTAITIGYFVDKDYHELKKSGYYFPKLERLNFDTKYTKYLKQPKQK
jgi:hypothetical protein